MNTLNKKYNFSVYIGRFQPFHEGHLQVVRHALSLSEKLILIIGSDNKPIDWKNPWTTENRKDMIRNSLTEEEVSKVVFRTVEDRLYQNKEWEVLINDAVDSVVFDYGLLTKNETKICIVGYDKDDSSFYLKSFPQWKFEPAPAFSIEENDEALSATLIRDMMYHNRFGYIKTLLPDGSFNFVKEWLKTTSAAYVKEWFEQDESYQAPYEALPYGTNFYCADNVVLQSGHVLLIKRKFHPGKDLWALPGGHINKNENAFDASLRELEEETGLKIPEKVLIGSFQGEKLFDHPDRSLRGRCGKKVGRTVTISHCYVLNDERGLPRVKPADDAAEAWWFTLAEVRKMRSQVMEDHIDQINYWVSRVDEKKYR